MKYVRLLIPLVLLCLAVPAFAVCGYCGGDQNNTCTWFPGLGTKCHNEYYLCYTLCVEESSGNCNPGFTAHSFGTEFRILSVTVEGAKASPIKNESAVVPPKKLKKKA